MDEKFKIIIDILTAQRNDAMNQYVNVLAELELLKRQIEKDKQ